MKEMMKTKVLVLVIFALTVLSAAGQKNENRFSVELNAGGAMSVSKIDGSSLNPGGGFEGLFHYRFMPHLGVYAGWGWNKLSSDNIFNQNDICLEETGYVFGLQFMHPVEYLPFSYYIRAAGLYNHIEIENADGDIIEDTGHGFGFQLAGGLNFNLGNNWSLNPGVKFNTLSRKADVEEESVKMDYQYIALRIGIVKAF
jgi:opacity protein-like surface antigen